MYCLTHSTQPKLYLSLLNNVVPFRSPSNLYIICATPCCVVASPQSNGLTDLNRRSWSNRITKISRLASTSSVRTFCILIRQCEMPNSSFGTANTYQEQFAAVSGRFFQSFMELVIIPLGSMAIGLSDLFISLRLKTNQMTQKSTILVMQF